MSHILNLCPNSEQHDQTQNLIIDNQFLELCIKLDTAYMTICKPDVIYTYIYSYIGRSIIQTLGVKGSLHREFVISSVFIKVC